MEDWASYQVIGNDVFWFSISQSELIYSYLSLPKRKVDVYRTNLGRFFSLTYVGAQIHFKYFTKSELYRLFVDTESLSSQERQLLISQLNIQNG